MKTQRNLSWAALLPVRSALVAACALLSFARPAAAQLTIELEYDSSSDAPAWDAEGACLTRTMEAAARHWESFFPTAAPARTVHVRFRWFDPAMTVGLEPADPDLADDPLATTSRTLLGGVFSPNRFVVKFRTLDGFSSIPWFVDDDPSDDAEFEMRPTLFGSPSSATSTTGIEDAPSGPFALEVGFEGRARSADAATPACGEFDATAGYDLYSVALHELGHALGLGFRNKRDVRGDGDYDVPASLPGGGIGLEAARKESGAVDKGHLLAPGALMYPELGPGVRRLPCMADILAIATVNGWSAGGSVVLPRVIRDDAGIGLAFDESSAWIDQTPTAAQGAILEPWAGDMEVELAADVAVNAVYLAQPGGDVTSLLVGSHDLQAGQLISLGAGTSLSADRGSVTAEQVHHHGVELAIQNAGSLQVAGALEVFGGGVVRLAGTTAVPATYASPDGVLRLDDSAYMSSSNSLCRVGSVRLESIMNRLDGGGSLSTRFVGVQDLMSYGTIAAANGDLSFVPADDTVRFDLDGADETSETFLATIDGRGSVEAQGGSVRFEAPLADSFAGLMWIGPGRSITVAQQLELDDGGRIELRGNLASLYTGELRVNQASLLASGATGSSAYVHAAQRWQHGGLADVVGGNVLYLLGRTRYQGHLVSQGEGAVVQVGNLTVLPGDDGVAVTDVGVDHYLWDGERLDGVASAYSRTTITTGAELRIYGSIGSGVVGDGYDGQVTVEAGAVLYLADDWILEGELVLRGGTVLNGGTLTNRGTIRGHGTIATPVVNAGTVTCEGAGIVFTSTYVPAGGTCGPAGCCPP